MTQGRIDELFAAGHITPDEAADWMYQERWLDFHKTWHRSWELAAVGAVALWGLMTWWNP